ncbi:uncharacterized protein DSM5745_06627 [Aspergillus mulundensis]|uniref:Uncharacterized protein n=1 Tax=Aspergillus mulundensis TaxID=1810919 RepID=A0A3D8RRK4_9EURO|nr:hypothetical protein DSM5745_06627 [Aspergillus mulundensis]RDW76635.1 hypothetical protein DSM5745_06627 [Aspergillus mulundensis]
MPDAERIKELRDLAFDTCQKAIMAAVDVCCPRLRITTRSELGKSIKTALRELRTDLFVPKNREISGLTLGEVYEAFELKHSEMPLVIASLRAYRTDYRDDIPKSIWEENEEFNETFGPVLAKNEAVSRSWFDILYRKALHAANQEGIHGQRPLPDSMDVLMALGGRITSLSGRADYTVWYEETTDQMSTNLACIEMKKRGDAKKAIPQCLGYMGVVHRRRVNLKKSNTDVYGIATDGRVFYFLGIEKGYVRISEPLTWDMHNPAEAGVIWRGLRAIVRQATALSPLNSRNPTDET